jgi:hypothetical protein
MILSGALCVVLGDRVHRPLAVREPAPVRVEPGARADRAPEPRHRVQLGPQAPARLAPKAYPGPLAAARCGFSPMYRAANVQCSEVSADGSPSRSSE